MSLMEAKKEVDIRGQKIEMLENKIAMLAS
jgi:hypothetical protein